MANIALNNIKNITVVNCALGDVNLEHYIECSGSNIGGNYISERGDNVLVLKLDDFVLDNVKLIKIDVEGFELKVLKGAIRTIIRNKPDIFIECINQVQFMKVNRFLERIGYKYTGLRFNNTPTYLFRWDSE
jgi:FkbM family methyltransferase